MPDNDFDRFQFDNEADCRRAMSTSGPSPILWPLYASCTSCVDERNGISSQDDNSIAQGFFVHRFKPTGSEMFYAHQLLAPINRVCPVLRVPVSRGLSAPDRATHSSLFFLPSFLRVFAPSRFNPAFSGITGLARGSRASRRPSPMKLIERTARAIMHPGGTQSHGCDSKHRQRLRVRQHVAPARCRRLHAQAEKRQPRFQENRLRHAKRRRNDHRGEGVRQEVPEDQARVQTAPTVRPAITKSRSRKLRGIAHARGGRWGASRASPMASITLRMSGAEDTRRG